MSAVIRGDVEAIAQSAQQLQNFASDLGTTLKSLKDVVDTIAQGTYGTASTTLTDTYYALDADLNKFVDTLDQTGSNVNTSSQNLSSIDDQASRGLSYEG
ncbi:MAG: WXG100 family type VII secretion target [Butyrivibrio sp.]|nr:WXG100 family type VII secretion target [Butyrivibrio sp.]